MSGCAQVLSRLTCRTLQHFKKMSLSFMFDDPMGFATGMFKVILVGQIDGHLKFPCRVYSIEKSPMPIRS